MRILRAADEALASGERGAVGALCRREGIYSSNLLTWRKQREAGELAALTPKKRGRRPTQNPLAEEVARLEREKAKLEEKLRKAEIVIDVQKKVAALLGNPLPEAPEDEETTS
ncbi:MAG: helix-turn-helix domain-containing protein [Kofleriaceae bacterium]|nr:helix-turn-helix domain-containing protein [Kofleriaceae bacterium]